MKLQKTWFTKLHKPKIFVSSIQTVYRNLRLTTLSEMGSWYARTCLQEHVFFTCMQEHVFFSSMIMAYLVLYLFGYKAGFPLSRMTLNN